LAAGEKDGASMVAKARNDMAARVEQVKSGNLAWGVEGAFMAAPNRGLLLHFSSNQRIEKREARGGKPSFPQL
jgi:hypothetical protein